MAWQIEIDEAAKKEFGKLDPQVARRVIQFLRNRLQSLKDPRSIGQALKGLLSLVSTPICNCLKDFNCF